MIVNQCSVSTINCFNEFSNKNLEETFRVSSSLLVLLSNRTHSVQFKNQICHKVGISIFPQGDQLSPLLILLFINNIT